MGDLVKRANHTIGVAKVEEFVYTSMVRIDTTIMDHSRVFLSILRAPQRNHRFAPRCPQAIYVSAFCPMLGLGKRANHTIGVAKMREFLHTGTLMRDTTILDHSGVVLSILRAPQLYLKFAPRSPQAIWLSAFCPMLGPGKRANHTIGVAKMREFRALGPHEPSQDLQRPSQELSRPSQETPCTL